MAALQNDNSQFVTYAAKATGESKYSLGFVQGDLSKLFAPIISTDYNADEGGAPATQTIVEDTAAYHVVPIGYPLDPDAQYAVYRSGRVEKAFALYDEQNPEYDFGPGDPDGATPMPKSHFVSASDLAALGIDPDIIPHRAPSTLYNGRYQVSTALTPPQHLTTLDAALMEAIRYAFTFVVTAVVSADLGPVAGAAAGAAASSQTGEAGAPINITPQKIGGDRFTDTDTVNWLENLLNPKPVQAQAAPALENPASDQTALFVIATLILVAFFFLAKRG